MDLSAHILDAVQTASDPLPRRSSARQSSSQRHRSRPRFTQTVSAKSSYDNLSTVGDDSEVENGYSTSLTSPSEASHEDMSFDDIDDFRDREYPQLKGKVYLDHSGTTLYARSLVEEFSADLIANLYGNPHSASTPSAIAGHRVDAVRERALRFFGADPAHFDLVFVANATAAIKLVIDCCKDYAASTNTPVWYGYHRDAHTSIVGIRESTKLHRCFTTDEEVDIWINSGGLGGPRARQLGLFAYPGQSNMTGRRLPTSWPGRIRKQLHKAATYTLLDAAALASTAPLDLSDPATAPDFVALSFYKIFGFPNIGALIVRKDSAHVLQQRKYFGGGTVEMIISISDVWHAKKDTSIHDRLEDGTLPFHSIFALDHAMNVHERLYGPMPMKWISNHTARLGKQLYDSLSVLTHSNGTPLAKIYKDDAAVYGDASLQGATIAFNVCRPDGSIVGYADVEEAADKRNIYLRSGSLCNPGGMATYLEWTPAEMRAAYAAGHRCSKPVQIMLGRPTGVVRVSLGAMSNAADVRALIHFLEDVYLNKQGPGQPSATRNITSSKSLRVPAINTTGGTSSLQHSPVSPSPPSLSLPFTGAADDFAASANPESSTPAERPRFNPADYAKHRRPWEEELRKGHWASPSSNSNGSGQNAANDYKNYSLPSSSRQTNTSTSSPNLNGSGSSPVPGGDDNATITSGRASVARHPTPSLKARKFGRSMVNLLRARDKTGPPPSTIPTSPAEV